LHRMSVGEKIGLTRTYDKNLVLPYWLYDNQNDNINITSAQWGNILLNNKPVTPREKFIRRSAILSLVYSQPEFAHRNSTTRSEILRLFTKDRPTARREWIPTQCNTNGRNMISHVWKGAVVLREGKLSNTIIALCGCCWNLSSSLHAKDHIARLLNADIDCTTLCQVNPEHMLSELFNAGARYSSAPSTFILSSDYLNSSTEVSEACSQILLQLIDNNWANRAWVRQEMITSSELRIVLKNQRSWTETKVPWT